MQNNRTFFQRGYDEGVHDTQKAFGDCTKCYGKGYATVMRGLHGASDFEMNQKGFDVSPTVHLNYCSCGRGKELAKIMKQTHQYAQEEIEEEMRKFKEGFAYKPKKKK